MIVYFTCICSYLRPPPAPGSPRSSWSAFTSCWTNSQPFSPRAVEGSSPASRSLPGLDESNLPACVIKQHALEVVQSGGSPSVLHNLGWDCHFPRRRKAFVIPRRASVVCWLFKDNISGSGSKRGGKWLLRVIKCWEDVAASVCGHELQVPDKKKKMWPRDFLWALVLRAGGSET